MKKKKSGDGKIIFLLLFILVACFVAIGVLFYKYFYSGASDNKYGDRLEGIENYKLSDSLESDIQAIYKDNKTIDSVVVDVQGKIIYLNFKFKGTVKVETAKSDAIKALDKIGEENLKFYDVHFVLTYVGEEGNDNFPIFGAKSSSSLKVVW